MRSLPFCLGCDSWEDPKARRFPHAKRAAWALPHMGNQAGHCGILVLLPDGDLDSHTLQGMHLGSQIFTNPVPKPRPEEMRMFCELEERQWVSSWAPISARN